MTIREYDLTQDEVFRAELMSFRIILQVLTHAFLEGVPDRNAAINEIKNAAGQILAQISLQALPQERQETFRALVLERSHVLLDGARTMRRTTGKRH